VEKLLSLEHLNVQDNQLKDPTETARLTGIPNLKRIWVKRNPYTKLYPDHRITTFNLFRKTPGYVDDIVIDESGPGYSERKQLVERAPEIERQLAQPAIRIAEHPIIVRDVEPTKSIPTATAELSTNSTRRKKAPRRRIVDLAKDESFARIPDEDIAATIPASNPVLDRTLQAMSTSPSQHAPDSSTSSNDDAHKASINSLGDVSDENNEQDDDYRAKIEALRQEFGSNWLSALGDQNWHNSHHLELTQGQTITQESLHHSGQHIIVSGGRTLG
jgi:hypothetical protein